MAHYLQISGTLDSPKAADLHLERELLPLRAKPSGDNASQNRDDGDVHDTTEAVLPSTGERPTPCDLFCLLESKPVWSIEELAPVLGVSRKTLYKQAKRGKLPSFRIGSCVRLYGKGLADHLRAKMKR